MGDPRLLLRSEEVTDPRDPAIRELVSDMFETMRAVDGAGLAAPQIGVPLRVVIFGYRDQVRANPRYPGMEVPPETILINPELTPLGEDLDDGWEGCLSVPGMRGMVPRLARIRYCGFDPLGQPIEREADGFHARVVQHECDHLIGRLYPTRMTDLTQLGFTSVLFPELADAADD
jgi:peptide deformylase